MTTAIGPQSPHYSTVRPPTAAVVSGAADTWFVDCSASGAKDGTYLTASWLNMVIAQLRYAIRTAGIVLDDVDDAMLFKAIRAIVTSYGGNFLAGAFNGAAPDATVGQDGQYAFDVVSGKVYGPKTGGAWPVNPVFSPTVITAGYGLRMVSNEVQMLVGTGTLVRLV